MLLHEALQKGPDTIYVAVINPNQPAHPVFSMTTLCCYKRDMLAHISTMAPKSPLLPHTIPLNLVQVGLKYKAC
jgi:hypothetical protein